MGELVEVGQKGENVRPISRVKSTDSGGSRMNRTCRSWVSRLVSAAARAEVDQDKLQLCNVGAYSAISLSRLTEASSTRELPR